MRSSDYYDGFREGQLAYSLQNRSSDKYPACSIKGEVFWTMTDIHDGSTVSGHRKNIVTLDASILLARLVKGTGSATPHQSEPNFGAFALAIGTGDVSWDPNAPPLPTNAQRSLFNELSRKAIQSSSFIDQDGGISGVPTNIIDLTTIFGASEAVGPLTEMGLLGGDVNPNMSIVNPVLPPNGVYDPTVNVIGKDALVNYTTFPVINKPPTSTLSWTWRLTL